ncbi:hypothetical protein BDU57DRAFT_542619 [Ampelomyces quisqualis]|uniref:Zn(2)-C6 fungal-type domain-containing protein n=1 Tax=Ampelomyces quisqualis TaxID=50730 RepID=A0A6A5Q995_AMPQU|nr:hypothetical protein BDU57DRAFT_542619 [Ampelomyces quisqualis]
MEPTERWQPIAPASDEPGQQRSAPDPKKRRQAIAVACLPCRSSKVKCDGMRPRCTRCSELDLSCRFDVAEGVSRAERMKLLKRESMSGKAEEMERVIRALRTSSDDHASVILARLRIGDRLEDIVKDLPPLSAFSPVVSKPPSLLGRDSGSSGSHVSGDATAGFNDTRGTLYGQDSQATSSPLGGQLSVWLPSISTTSPSTKGKQPATDTAKPPFLFILFDRDDYLRDISESENEDEAEAEATADVDVFIDPRILAQSSAFDSAGATTASSAESSRSRQQSPKKDQKKRVHALTHLSSRQPIVNTLRIHPNFNLRNLFGNMPFSSSVLTNNYPAQIQDIQVNNLFLPTWAMMTVNTRPDPGSLKTAFYSLYGETSAMLANGTSAEAIIEVHPNIAALFDEEEYNRSGVLSKWVAGIVHSSRLKGNDFTAFAMMYTLWYLMRWMISPSAETYELMPEWLRPTPNQLFMPHIQMLDTIIWPAFREYAVQIPEMQERMEWLMDMSNTIRCDWYHSNDEALERNKETGLLDLCDLAKTSVRDLTSWAVGPSFRQYVTNADSYVRIRAESF